MDETEVKLINSSWKQSGNDRQEVNQIHDTTETDLQNKMGKITKEDYTYLDVYIWHREQNNETQRGINTEGTQ